MKRLKTILAKDPSTLTSEEKAYLGKHWDFLNEDLRAKFADAAPADAGEDADEDEDEDGELDEKALQDLIEKSGSAHVSKAAERIAKGLAEAFSTTVEDARAKFAATGTAAAGKNKEHDELTRKFIQALTQNDKAALREMSKAITTSSEDDASAGYTIPEPLANEVLRITQAGYGVARREFAYHRLSEGNTLRITALGTVLSVSWIDEGEKKPSSQPSFEIVTLTLKKLAVIVPMTEEVVEDSGINLTALIGELIREAIEKEEDMQFFNGDGTVWTGILHDTSIPSDTLAATKYAASVRPEDIINLADNTPLSVNGKYYGNRTILSKLRTLRQNADGTGDYLYNPLGAGSEFGTINGYPFVPVEAMPTLSEANAANEPFLIFGDLKRGVAYGEKSDVRLKTLDQATITDVDGETVINLAEQDMLGIRAVKRVGMKVTLPEAMNRLVSGPVS